jgi:hypothetical protein
MFDTVVDGSMPPGPVGLDAFQQAGYRYPDGRPLERPESTEGQEVYRAWLACNGPVVAATATPANATMAGSSCSAGAGEEVTAVGDCVYRQGGRTIEPTWTAIFNEIVGPAGSGTCVPSCHTDGAAFATQSQLVFDDKDAAYAALVGQPAMGMAEDGTMCMDEAPNRVVPNDPDGSFLVQKLEEDASDLCGNPMPIGRRLAADPEIAAIRAWIEMGAMDN